MTPKPTEWRPASTMVPIEHRGHAVTLPARLSPQMRQAWSRCDGWATREQMDAIWEAMQAFAVRPINRN
jgi:hypothetical protein